MKTSAARASHCAKKLSQAEADALVRIDMPLNDHWITRAAEEGYEILARVQDRWHLLLRCLACRGHIVTAYSTLTSGRPLCGHCIERGHQQTAQQAGLVYLHRDPVDPKCAYYLGACGHVLRRQRGRAKAMTVKGQDVKCEICLVARESAEAMAHDWERLGSDPKGRANYRLYRHLCGNEQCIAVANMRTRRCKCAGCGKGWFARPSYLYVMRFTLPDGRDVVKLGYASDPASRLQHQLKRKADLPSQLLLQVPIATGKQALISEKGLHRQIRTNHPDAVVSPDRFRHLLRVESEIYDAVLTQMIIDQIKACRTVPA